MSVTIDRYGNDRYQSSHTNGWMHGRYARPTPVTAEQALLQAAADVFFEQGYVATSIDAIIERAGGSKRNIYSEFGSKQGLFAAIVRENSDSALSTLAADDVEGLDLAETLAAFGRHLMDVYMSPTVVGIYRIAVTEAHRFRTGEILLRTGAGPHHVAAGRGAGAGHAKG